MKSQIYQPLKTLNALKKFDVFSVFGGSFLLEKLFKKTLPVFRVFVEPDEKSSTFVPSC
jgi:hypothetical protein